MFTYVGDIMGFCYLPYEKWDIEMRQKGKKEAFLRLIGEGLQSTL